MDPSSTKHQTSCGSCEQLDNNKCAFDRYTSVPSEELDDDDAVDLESTPVVRYCKCMSAADLKATNDKDKDLDIEVGEIVSVASCKSKPSDWEGSDVAEVVEFELKKLSEDEMDKISEKKDQKKSDLYHAIVNASSIGDYLILKCNPDDLERSPKWIFEDDDDVGLDDAHKCIRTEPRMVLRYRRRASSKSFSNRFRTSTLKEAHETAKKHHARAQEMYRDFLCKEENPDAVKAVLNRGKGEAKFVQDATCRFSDDPKRVLSSRGSDEVDDESNREFPLYVCHSNYKNIIQCVREYQASVLLNLGYTIDRHDDCDENSNINNTRT